MTMVAEQELEKLGNDIAECSVLYLPQVHIIIIMLCSLEKILLDFSSNDKVQAFLSAIDKDQDRYWGTC